MRVTGNAKQAISALLRRAGYGLVNLRKGYSGDGLHTLHHAPFLDDPHFRAAYEQGIRASQGHDPRFAWKIHIGIWAAEQAARVPGDFIECGVNAGFFSSALLGYLDWGRLGKTLHLVDTFAGPPVDQYTPEEIAAGRRAAAESALAAGGYVTEIERIRSHFSAWQRVEIVAGRVPEILRAVTARDVSFLHLDMNSSVPETAALHHFWPRLSAGAIVLLDDYVFHGCEAQTRALADAAAQHGASILALPTGQGLILR